LIFTSELADVLYEFSHFLVLILAELEQNYITDMVPSTSEQLLRIVLDEIFSSKVTMFYYRILFNSILNSSTCSVERGLLLYIETAQVRNIIIKLILPNPLKRVQGLTHTTAIFLSNIQKQGGRGFHLFSAT
jgi:hypothetical protein